MNYPLNLTFKIVALAPQLSITDTAGNLHFYVKQKLFKLKCYGQAPVAHVTGVR